MISLEQFSVFIPSARLSVLKASVETGLSSELLKIFHAFYGLNTLAIYSEGNILSLIENVFHHFKINKNIFTYFVHLHTADWVLPESSALLSALQSRYQFSAQFSFSFSQARCASYFLLWEFLLTLSIKNPDLSALVLTGEIAFTPELRVVPHSSLTSDVATLALWRAGCKDHCLLAVETFFLTGYSKGIYLTAAELKLFDTMFIEKMHEVVMACLKKAGLSLVNIQLILPHNVNIRTWQHIANRLAIGVNQILMENIKKLGHAFCSDHLINLQTALDEKRLHKGDYYLSVGCGMGFTLAAAVFQY